MPKTLILYDSVGKSTKMMAEILRGEFKAHNEACDLFFIEDFNIDRLPEYDGFFIGTPNYFGSMTNRLKRLLDESVKFYKKLDGRVGAAFCSTGIVGGGGETAIMSVVKALLIHGMIIQGNPSGGHYGVLSIGKPDKRVEEELRQSAGRFIALLNKVRR